MQGVKVLSYIYQLLYRFILPYLPDIKFATFLKWKSALSLVGTEFHAVNLAKQQEKLAKHFLSETPLQMELQKLLNVNSYEFTPKVLDVGAGPVSKVGKIYQGKSIDLVPVDPMAKKYIKLLDKLNLEPPFPTLYGVGERLSQQFLPNSFDLIHARNSIDHCLNPVSVIREALVLLKSGHFFYLNHHISEGKAASYYGLHQWNFDIENNTFIITDRYSNKMVIDQIIADLGEVHQLIKTDNRIIVVLKKHAYL